MRAPRDDSHPPRASLDLGAHLRWHCINPPFVVQHFATRPTRHERNRHLLGLGATRLLPVRSPKPCSMPSRAAPSMSTPTPFRKPGHRPCKPTPRRSSARSRRWCFLDARLERTHEQRTHVSFYEPEGQRASARSALGRRSKVLHRAPRLTMVPSNSCKRSLARDLRAAPGFEHHGHRPKAQPMEKPLGMPIGCRTPDASAASWQCERAPLLRLVELTPWLVNAVEGIT